MRLNKRVFYFSIIVSLITILISAILNFAIEETDVSIFIVNILMNIFAGTVVLIVTSMFDYFIQKRDLFENIYLEANKLFTLFNEIKYFDDIVENFENYIEGNEILQKLSIKEKNKIYNKYLSRENKKNKEKILKVMDTYIKISQYDCNNFWNLYKEIDFIFDYNKNREFLYYNFFNYINDKINLIKEQTYHFFLYKESKVGNYIVNSQKIKELQKNIFYVEEKKLEKDWEGKKTYKDYPLYTVETNFKYKTSRVIINDVGFKINDIRNKIYDITYNINNKKKSKA